MSSASCQSWVVHQRALDFERIGRHWLFVLVFAWLTILAANLVGAALKNVGFTVSDPLNAGYGWTTNGNVVIGGGQAVLTEDGVHYPVHMAQQFTLSSNVARIHLTIQALNLVTNEVGQPADAFQISLVGTNEASLVGDTGQGGTTAFFNYQQDGKVYYGSAVTVPGATGSSNVWQPQFPVTLVLDVTVLTNDVTATLSFDLLGIDKVASSVTLTQVRLEGIEPVVAADTVATLEDTAAVISILTNDTAKAGVPLDPASIQIVSLPANGTATVNTVTGTIGYQPTTNYAGADSFTYTVADIAGNRSAAATVSVTVTPVNDAPGFTKGADLAVNEDAGAQTVAGWATAISKGPADEAGQSVNFLVSNDNNALFSVQPAVGANGTLTYTPAANANGAATVTVQIHDDGGTANSGVDSSASQTFTITVNAVNDAPSFTRGADLAVNEDAGAQTVAGWATAISRGPANEAGQSVDFLVSNDNNALFSVQPGVGANGTLTYTAAANANGAATVTVQIHDDGGTVNSGVDTSAGQTFTIIVSAVNDAPSFTKGADLAVNEDAGAQTVAGWATAISKGPANEAGQSVDFLVSNDNNALFSVQPAIGANGTLTYTPAANANGAATVTVQIHDDGGTVNSGMDTSVAQTFTITVSAVNDAPSFTKGADLAVNEDAGTQTVTGWATAISKGPADEAGQSVNFLVSNDNNALFSMQPAVGANGTLTYTPAANANGAATVTVQIHDDGGTANSGVDTSVAQTFTITVNAVNDAPALEPVANQLLAPGQSLSLTLTASDVESPVGNLQFSLLSGPAAMTVSPAGTLQWTAPTTETVVTNEVSVKVIDDGVPAQSATQTFSVIVIPKPALQISRTGSSLTIQWPSVPGLRYQLQSATDIGTPVWTDLGTESVAAASTMSQVDEITPVPSRKFYRLRVGL